MNIRQHCSEKKLPGLLPCPAHLLRGLSVQAKAKSLFSLLLALEILQEPLLKSPHPEGSDAISSRVYGPLTRPSPSPCLWRTHPGPLAGRGWKRPGKVLLYLPHPRPQHRGRALTLGRIRRGARMAGGTWNMLAPYGVLQALRRLSFPVLTNHLPAGGRQRKHQVVGCCPLK